MAIVKAKNGLVPVDKATGKKLDAKVIKAQDEAEAKKAARDAALAAAAKEKARGES